MGAPQEHKVYCATQKLESALEGGDAIREGKRKG